MCSTELLLPSILYGTKEAWRSLCKDNASSNDLSIVGNGTVLYRKACVYAARNGPTHSTKTDMADGSIRRRYADGSIKGVDCHSKS